jgi:hypothetical protein
MVVAMRSAGRDLRNMGTFLLPRFAARILDIDLDTVRRVAARQSFK